MNENTHRVIPVGSGLFGRVKRVLEGVVLRNRTLGDPCRSIWCEGQVVRKGDTVEEGRLSYRPRPFRGSCKDHASAILRLRKLYTIHTKLLTIDVWRSMLLSSSSLTTLISKSSPYTHLLVVSLMLTCLTRTLFAKIASPGNEDPAMTALYTGQH